MHLSECFRCCVIIALKKYFCRFSIAAENVYSTLKYCFSSAIENVETSHLKKNIAYRGGRLAKYTFNRDNDN